MVTPIKKDVRTFTKSQIDAMRQQQLNPQPIIQQPVQQSIQPISKADIQMIRGQDLDATLEVIDDIDSWIAYDWEGDKPVAINVKATIQTLKDQITSKFAEIDEEETDKIVQQHKVQVQQQRPVQQSTQPTQRQPQQTSAIPPIPPIPAPERPKQKPAPTPFKKVGPDPNEAMEDILGNEYEDDDTVGEDNAEDF